MENMTTQEQISKSQNEREEARQGLRDTLSEVNAKVERASADLRPEHLIESHPVGAALAAGVLGFVIGSTVRSRATGPIIIAAAIGFALSLRSSRESSLPDGRETDLLD